MIATLPPELRQLDRWLPWKKGSIKSDGRFDKIPLDPETGHVANDKDPSTWRSFDVAQTAADRWGRGLGIALGDGLAGSDVDHCRDPRTGVITRWAWHIIHLFNSYTEISPSGTGVKIYVWGTLAKNISGPVEGGAVELYADRRFFAFTGQHLEGTPLEVRDGQAVLDALAAELAPPVDDTPRPLARPRPVVARSGERSGRDVIAQFNADHPLPDLLASYGAPVRSQGSERFTFGGLPGDKHSHRVTYTVSRGRAGGWIGFAHSPNSRLHNSRGFDAFTVYCTLEGLTPTEAIKRLAPPLPRPTPAPPAPTPTPEQLAQREADAARKRETRRAEAAYTRASVEAHAREDEALTECEQVTLLAFLDACGDRDCMRWSNARLAEHSGFSDRYIRNGLAGLERKGYIRSERRVNGEGEVWSGGKSTIWRTLLRWHGYTGDATVYNTYELVSQDQELVRGGGEAQPVAPIAPEPQPEPIAVEGGASYTPSVEPAEPPAYTGRSRRHAGSEQHLAWLACYHELCGRPRVAAPDLDAEQHQLVEPEPDLVPSPPSDPAQRSRYYALLGAARKAQKAGRERQAWKLYADARALEELRPPTSAPQPSADAPPPRSQAPTLPTPRRPTRSRPAQPALVEQLAFDAGEVHHAA